MTSSRRKILSLIAVLTVLALFAWVAPGQTEAYTIDPEIRGGWQPGPEAYHPTRLLVRFSDNIVTAQAATDYIEQIGYSVRSVVAFDRSATFPNGLRIGIIEVPEEGEITNAVARLSAAPSVIYVERDPIHYPAGAGVFPDDPRFPELWGLHNQGLHQEYWDPRMPGQPVDDADIDMPEGWELNTGSGEVVVAVIDTGCYIHHPDLAEHIWVNEAEINGEPGVDDDGNGYIDDIYGWNFYDWNNSVWNPDQRDFYGDLADSHGTHVAGTIGAATNNALGIAGVNWNVKIMPLKFLGPNGGYTSDAILSVEYAAANGATFTNNSWGGGGYSQALKDAIEASGMLFIAAAGNSGNDNDAVPYYPSTYDCPNIISVAASMQNDQPCAYPSWWSTSYGATTVDLFAPGGYILSTLPPETPLGPGDAPAETYGFYYGTSMATPHVSGVAALVIDKYPSMAQYPGAPGYVAGEMTVMDAILGSVERKPAFEGWVATGGRLNAKKALSLTCPPAITSVTASPIEGQPPLEVTFAATAQAFGGSIESVWWDFGDGTPFVYDWTAVHVYTEEGMFTATFHVVDDSGLEAKESVSVTVALPARIGVAPTSIESSLRWGETDEKTVAISNTGTGDLQFRVDTQILGRIQGQGGGPDRFGYVWMDSDDAAGPRYEWIDISTVGTEVTLAAPGSVQVNLPFSFPFYGEPKTKVRISSCGYLAFGGGGSTSRNAPIPTSASPNDIIAVMWYDMLTTRGGHVYYYDDGDKFIVQWDDVPARHLQESYSFQAILTPDGIIRCNYLRAQGTAATRSTVGIENKTGTDGLQVSFQQEYLHDNLSIVYVPAWLTLDPVQGVVAPGDTLEVIVELAGICAPAGEWKANLVISSNDKIDPSVTMDTTLHLSSLIPPVIDSITANPPGGDVPLTVVFAASAYDFDGEITDMVWDFGDGSGPVAGTLTPSHTYAAEGDYVATLTVTDDTGLSASSTLKIAVRPLPLAHVTPHMLNGAINAHQSRTERVIVSNSGNAALTYELNIEESLEPSIDRAGSAAERSFGGPDEFGYVWIDSDQPGGPEFDWVEISDIGTYLSTIRINQYQEVDLPWEFPFYGENKTKIKINANGHLTFGKTGTNPEVNNPIPFTQLPNDVIAPWWTNFQPRNSPAGGGVFCYHDTENDRFIVEYNQVPHFLNRGRMTFEVILYPDGRILFQYLDMAFAREDEAQATVGIENRDGTGGLEILYNEVGYIHDEMAILMHRPDWLSSSSTTGTLEPGESAGIDVEVDFGDIVVGTYRSQLVLNTNDPRQPEVVIPVTMTAIPNMPPDISACGVSPVRGPQETEFLFTAAVTDHDGQIVDCYWAFGDGSPSVHGLVAEHRYATEGTYTAQFTAIDNGGYKSVSKVAVCVEAIPSALWTPERLMLRATQGQHTTDVIVLSNEGPGMLCFDPHYDEVNPLGESHAPGVGKVLASWVAPEPITNVWGVAYNYRTDELIVGDSKERTNYILTPDGQHTGKNWFQSFAGSWGADMAFDGRYIWQVDVGITMPDRNGIVAVNPETGKPVAKITDPDGVWDGLTTTRCQRGLAYNPNDDTFYIAGWEESRIYHIKGLSWDNPGEILEPRWRIPVGISGLAYHPTANTLIVVTNERPDMIYLVDPVSKTIIDQCVHPGPEPFSGAGCDLDAYGNLWVASQSDSAMYLVETGLGPIDGWLSWNPRVGMVEPGQSVDIRVTADARRLEPGVYEDTVVVATNDPERRTIAIPVAVEVVRPPAITQVDAAPHAGEAPLTVAFMASVEAIDAPIASCRWDFGDGEFADASEAEHTYAANGRYLAVFTVTDELGGVARAAITVEVGALARATVSTTLIEATIPANGSKSATVTLGNAEGTAPLDYRVRMGNGEPGLVGPVRAVAEPMNIGDVMSYIQLPDEIVQPVGVALDTTDGDIWIGDGAYLVNYVITPWGTHTGRVIQTLWQDTWASGLAYDENRQVMWQLNVDGDNAIYGLDHRTGEVVYRIATVPWTQPQLGLAYNSEDDTFYAGGMFDQDIIYHIKGMSWDNPGELLDKWQFPVSIVGLAWHPDGLLWVAGYSDPDMIYAIEPSTRKVVHAFRHPERRGWNSGGMSIDYEGNLLVPSMEECRLYTVYTGMPICQGIAVEPKHGTVQPGESGQITVTMNAAGLGRGGQDMHRHLAIETNDLLNPVLYIDLAIHIQRGPAITACAASTALGEPPLEVVFTAEVAAGEAPISATWWEFGDGSDPVNGVSAKHVYTLPGTYEATFHAVDENEAEATQTITVTVKWLPAIAIVPESFYKAVAWGTESQDKLSITNTGNAPLSFAVSVSSVIGETDPVSHLKEAASGPDQFGYIWEDSDQPDGPKFDWVEISQIGAGVQLGNEFGATLDLPFAFPFYGEFKTCLIVNPNGFLAFDNECVQGYWLNSQIPDMSLPNGIIAPFWDDLDPGRSGAGVYYYYDEANERFIVEYHNVPRINNQGMLEAEGFTFEVILKPDGSIIYQYLSMAGDVTSATVGVEDQCGADGLEIVYNAPYIRDGLAIRISPIASLIRMSADSGYLLPGTSDDITVTFGSPKAAPGTYSLKAHVLSDDPMNPVTVVPVTVKVNMAPTAQLMSPAGGDVWSGEKVIRWKGNDWDDESDTLIVDLHWTRNGVAWNEIATGIANTGTYMWNTALVGEGGDTFQVRVTVTDPAGERASVTSGLFTITNDSPVAGFSFSPSQPTVSDIVSFADESTDDGEIVAWHWEFGDGAESFEQNPKHEYSAKGKLTVKLTVTDDGGLTGVCEKQIQVVNVAPEVRILKPEAGAVWTGTRAIEYEAADADGDVLVIKLEYDYLDDEVGWQLIVDEEENTGKYLWDTSKLSRGGIYKVRVTASDPDGGIGQDVSQEFTIIVLKRMVMVAPNPARNSVTFYYDTDTDGELFVYDVAGRLVHTAKLSATANSHEWNLTTGGRPVASGLYLYVVITDAERSEVGRLVIERL